MPFSKKYGTSLVGKLRLWLGHHPLDIFGDGQISAKAALQQEEGTVAKTTNGRSWYNTYSIMSESDYSADSEASDRKTYITNSGRKITRYDVSGADSPAELRAIVENAKVHHSKARFMTSLKRQIRREVAETLESEDKSVAAKAVANKRRNEAIDEAYENLAKM